MSLATLAPRRCFGFRADVRNSVHWLEGNNIAYLAGHTIVVMNTDTRQQRFIPCTAAAASITALAISPNLKSLAVAEAPSLDGETRACITIYDLQTHKRRKTLSSSESGNSTYVDLHFSPDSRMLLSQVEAPDWTLILWMWEKAKISSMARTGAPAASVLSARFAPGDSGIISVLGTNFLRMLRCVDGTLKTGVQPLSKRDPQEYLSQVWVSEVDRERLVIGCVSGELLLLESLELKAVLHTEAGGAADALLPWSKGFLVGQSNGMVSVFERDDRDSFQRSRALRFKEPKRISTLSMSSGEGQLAVATPPGHLYTLAFRNLEILKLEEDNFEALAGMDLPAGPLTGLDVCLRKPLVATTSVDKAVRIWNWNDTALEMCKYFQDEAYSIAMHPNGMLVAVGFADKLRLMAVLMDDLKVYREFAVKQCCEVRFSRGGHLFAAVNGMTVHVYNTYTAENIATLRGHSGKVTALFWSPDDTKLTSAGRDGAVYEWRLADLKRCRENVLKGCQYSGVVQSPDGLTIFTAGGDGTIKEMEDSPNSGTQIKQELATGDVITAIALSSGGKVMYASTQLGAVRSYRVPLNGDFNEIRSHSSAVTGMRLLFDDTLLFTVSNDGSLFVFDVRSEAKATARRDLERLPFAEEVMVAKSDLEERRSRYQELETKYNEQLRQNQITIHIKDLETREKIKELTEKFALESESERQRYELLQQQKVETEMEYNERLKSEEDKKQQQLAALDSQYQAKIMSEVERYQALMQEKELLNHKWDEQNATLVEAHEKVVQEIAEEMEAKLMEEQTNYNQLQQQKEDMAREFEEVKQQLEEDADREIETMKERYEAKLAVERKLAVTLKGENGLMRKRFNGLENSIDEQKAEIRRLHEAQETLYTTIATHEKDIQAFKEEVKERDNTISEKEKRIYDLKKKNQELEKFKFVLDHKIKELKKQIEPKEEEIADMKEQIKEMDQELERYHKSNAQLDLNISDLKLKQEGLKREVLSQCAALERSHASIKEFKHDIHDVVQSLQDPKELKEKVKVMYQKHITSPVETGPVEEGVHKEYHRQRDYLEKTVQSLKNKLHKDTQLHRTDNLRAVQENVALIKEINELRRETKSLKVAAARQPGAAGKGGDAKEVEMQRGLIAELRRDVAAKEARIAQLEAQIMPRPMSREQLPPMEGFKGARELAK